MSVRRKTALGALGVMIAMLVVGLQSLGAGAQTPGQGSSALTIDDLRRGGYVIYFRHATADVGADQAMVVPEDCNTQRNLSEQGLRESRMIGQAFRMLDIPVGLVQSSEYCRVLETARIAFGHAEPATYLNFCCMDGRPLSGEARIALVRAALGSPPAAGANTILVSHVSSVVPDQAMGEGAVFQPDGNGGYRPVARIMPNEWESGMYRVLNPPPSPTPAP